MTDAERIAELRRDVAMAMASANVLFEGPSGEGIRTHARVHGDLLDAYLSCLRSIRTELEGLSGGGAFARRYYDVVDEGPDSVDYANHLMVASEGRSFAAVLTECIWDASRERRHASASDEEAGRDPGLVHALAHARRLFEVGLEAPARYMELLREGCADSGDAALPRLDPTGLGSLEADEESLRTEDGRVTKATLEAIRDRIRSQDLFAGGRTFRPVHDSILPGELADIRSLEDLYGYQRERELFGAHFKDFTEVGKVQPLLVSGMPGVGKTHLSIACALSLPDVVLVNAPQDYLEEPLERLIGTLGGYDYRRFVLLFDDVDAQRVDWSTFRNQVDGYLPYANNVAIVIATNGAFPPQIRSRCKVLEFRPMNPEVCREFVTDYLEEHKWMSQPYPDLVSTIVVDYASMFSRRLLNDLTPRSLIRYFEMLEGDKEKIRKLIRESLGEIVRVPTEEAFRESNRQIREGLAREGQAEAGLAAAPDSGEAPENAGRP